MPIVKWFLSVAALAFLFWFAGGWEYALAESISISESLSDAALGDIHAEGVTVGGDSAISCTTSTTSICVGAFEFNDNHQFDASVNKGAIVLDGYVQQNVSGEINLNQTQGSAATGANVLGNLDVSNSTLNMNNSNSAISFLGGF